MYKNIKLLCISEGIPIQYNNGETNIETVWAIDDKDKVIQNFTFETNIYPDQQILIKKMYYASDQDIVNIENGFLFYSFRYQISFAHWISQTVPYLTKYIKEYSHFNLLIPKHAHTTIQNELLHILKIPNDKIILLEDNIYYHCTNIIKPAPYLVGPPNTSTDDQIWIYQEIRNNLQITKNITPHKKIYLKRDGIANSKHGNSETGISRSILNSDELEQVLISYGFEIHTLGNKSFQEKYNTLKDTKLLISQLGANCMNLLFTNAPKNVLLVSNTTPLGENYYISLCQQLNKQSINYNIFYYNSTFPNADATNSMNGPYIVNIEEIQKWIEKNDI